MQIWLRCAFLMLSILVLTSCAHVVVVDGGAVEVEGIVADLTLDLFWKLASLQVLDSSAASRLLGLDARGTSEALLSMGVGFDVYRQQLASVAQVRPIVLFLAHDADPAEEALRRGIARIPWPPSAPPALLSGPQVDVLIVYEPLTSARTEPGRPGVAVARLASVAGLTRLSLAAGPSGDPTAIRRLYQVRPGEWKASVVFEHTRCVQPETGMELVTKLVYQGGSTDSRVTPLTERSWAPCALASDPDLRAATVKQPGLKKPGKPVIIAASYFHNPSKSYTSPMLAQWISVR
jgi:hypothetical protein